ncbi:Uncharacterized protein FWK35_00031916, partial [Aphis craccivora]
QLRQSLNTSRNNLTRVVWNGHLEKTILKRLDLDYSILNITCYDKYFNKNFYIQLEKLCNREIIFDLDIGKYGKTGRLLNLVETHNIPDAKYMCKI